MKSLVTDPITWGIIVVALLFGVTGYLVLLEMEQDARKTERCNAMGGYIGERSICRDRKSENVLATWEEL